MANLYVVATPIGNLSDISPRVKETLASCQLIAAEDTRVTAKLLSHLGLSVKMISCHQHNEGVKAEVIISKMLEENIDVALTCDAGTPAISDPGYLLVDAAWQAGIQVIPIAGPSAVVTAISASGFDSREFAFYGFLPRENKPLKEKLHEIWKSGMSLVVVYESPHRIVDLVEKVCEVLPGAMLAVCCDLTKFYEKIERGDAPSVLERLKANPKVNKGEYCMVMDLSHLPPYPKEDVVLSPELMLLEKMLAGIDMREAIALATQSGLSRNDVYKASLGVRSFLENYSNE